MDQVEDALEKRLPKGIVRLANLHNMSQVEMAKRSGLSRITINRFFRGKTQVKSEDLLVILKVLGVDLEKIINEKLKQLSGEVMVCSCPLKVSCNSGIA